MIRFSYYYYYYSTISTIIFHQLMKRFLLQVNHIQVSSKKILSNIFWQFQISLLKVDPNQMEIVTFHHYFKGKEE